MIEIDTRQVDAAIQSLRVQLSKVAINSAMSRSINRTITNERKVSRMAVKAKYNVTSADANKFKVYNANPNMLVGKLAADAKPIQLSQFNPTFNNTSYGVKVTRKKDKATGKMGSTKRIKKGGNKNFGLGVTVTIMKGNTMNISFAFLGKGGAIPVFAVGKYGQGKGFTCMAGRRPLTALMTTSLYQAVAGQVPRVVLNKNSMAFFNKTFTSELNYQILKLNGQV